MSIEQARRDIGCLVYMAITLYSESYGQNIDKETDFTIFEFNIDKLPYPVVQEGNYFAFQKGIYKIKNEDRKEIYDFKLFIKERFANFTRYPVFDFSSDIVTVRDLLKAKRILHDESAFTGKRFRNWAEIEREFKIEGSRTIRNHIKKHGLKLFFKKDKKQGAYIIPVEILTIVKRSMGIQVPPNAQGTFIRKYI